MVRLGAIRIEIRYKVARRTKQSDRENGAYPPNSRVDSIWLTYEARTIYEQRDGPIDIVQEQVCWTGIVCEIVHADVVAQNIAERVCPEEL